MPETLKKRINLHLRKTLNLSSLDLDYFKSYISSKEKRKTLLSLIRTPVFTVGVTEKVIDINKKVFEGKNPRIIFSNSGKDSEINEMLSEIKEKAYNWLWYNSQDLIYINLNNGKAQAELILEEDVIEVKETNDKVEYIKFKKRIGDNTKEAEIDKMTYKLDGEIIHEHNLTYCPVIYIEKKLSESRDSEILKVLSELDWLLFFEASKRHLDLYGSFPIMSVYESDCDYRYDDIECDRGVLKKNGQALYENNEPVACPICSSSRFKGAGSVVKLPMPERDEVNLMPPIAITSVNTNNLDRNVQEVERLINTIITRLTGEVPEQKQAVNEKQILSNYEGKKTIINTLARKLERIINFIVNTEAEIQGKKKIQFKYSFGTEFYLFTEAESLNTYIAARDKKLDYTILDTLYKEYIDAKYKNNPVEGLKQYTLFMLDEYRHLTIQEAMSIDPKAVLYKIYKNDFIEENKEFYLKTITELKKPYKQWKQKIASQVLIEKV